MHFCERTVLSGAFRRHCKAFLEYATQEMPCVLLCRKPLPPHPSPHTPPRNGEGVGGRGFRHSTCVLCSLILLCSSFPLINPLRRQEFACFVVVAPSLLIPLQPARPGPPHHFRSITTQRPPQQPRQTPAHRGDRHCWRVFFSPAVPPASGTTSLPTTTPGGDATPATSALGSPPVPLHSWLAAGSPRSDAPL